MMPRRRRLRRHLLWLVLVLVMTSTLAASFGSHAASAADANWQYTDRRLRLPVTVGANGYTRKDKTADIPLNFTALLSDAGVSGPFDPASLRVIELDTGGGVVDSAVPFQFDPAQDYEPSTNARGTLVVALTSTTAATTSRKYHVYFDSAETPFVAAIFPEQLTFTDGAMDEGFASYKFETNMATYYFQKEAGGFSSLVDAAGNDWIGWSEAAKSGGDFRGIPNLVPPKLGGYFHPGRRNAATSSILNAGPLKVTFRSVSSDRKWETVWEIYPTYARMTVTKAAGNYWFLYEGTPGGLLENNDRVVRSNGSETGGLGYWTNDLAGEEWVFFRDGRQPRSLFVAHEQEDTITDAYWTAGDEMTIFGFGRSGATALMKKVPQSFVIGLAEQTEFEPMANAVRSAYKPLSVTLDVVETTLTGPTCTDAPYKYYFSSATAGTVSGIPYQDEDVLLYDGSTCRWSLLFDGSALGLPAAADIDALEVEADGALYMSFNQPLKVPGIVGTVDDSDIVRYADGTFTLWFDGSNFGLTTSYEDVDGMSIDPGSNLVVSTLGTFSVPGAGKGQDEDLLRLENGAWTLMFDGSHNGGLAKEDIDGFDWLPDGTIYINVVDTFSLGSTKGDGNDLVVCRPISLGLQNTNCEYEFVWDGSARGMLGVDATAILPSAGS